LLGLICLSELLQKAFRSGSAQVTEPGNVLSVMKSISRKTPENYSGAVQDLYAPRARQLAFHSNDIAL
jgi:hypothetical protein